MAQMQSKLEAQPGKPQKPEKQEDSRKKRLAEALRRNLGRRKEQGQAESGES